MESSRDGRTDRQRLDDLVNALGGLEEELEALRLANNELNIFEVLGITNTEIRHSNVIAWLMNPKGKHGLGRSILASLIEHAGGNPPEEMSDFQVMRESENIDILAISRGNHMTLTIENKVWSGEHDDQLARYRAIVERRYPGWEHLYLFLSPAGLPPEGEDDREIWIPIDYRTLLGHVEDALETKDISSKARMLITDYVESVRRHIVGHESLQERCVEVYLEHKRAIDLIMQNLPDTSKIVHQYALDWATRKEGVCPVTECSHGKAYVRFRTKSLEECFPALEDNDSWGQSHFWFYEIETRVPKSGVGCKLKFQTSFYIPKKKQFPVERADHVRSFVTAFADESLGTFFGAYNGCYSKAVVFGPGEITYDEVSDACDTIWADFLKREERAIQAVF